MIIDIISLITNWITALATSITAYKGGRKKTIRADNYVKKLYVILNLYYEKYIEQLEVIKEVFRIENENENLCDIQKINDLEMIAYMESMMKACQNCIDEFPYKIESVLKNSEYDNLVRFFGYLKNFFRLTNEIKDKARKDKLEDKHITSKDYKNGLMKEIPYSLRNKCGGVNVDFVRFLENFDDMIKEMWKDIDKSLLDLEV